VEDIKEYIESGILELYVLGDLSAEEKLQVEVMASKHPAIRAELGEIELSLELFAQKTAVEPAEHLRVRVLNSILTNLADDNIFPDKTKKEEIKDNVIVLPRAGNFYKYAFAACIILLLASTIVIVNLYNSLQSSNQQIASLTLDKQRFANTVSLKDGELEVLQDASFKFLKLQGTPKSPASQMTVAWSPAKKKVWIDMKSLKVPQNDKTHQYQLWALVDGKPVDLGVFDSGVDTSDMKEMKSTAAAQAFAVTLEPRGGSISPTMDEMVVIGKF
jgi:anti-sigma-K factor RskA